MKRFLGKHRHLVPVFVVLFFVVIYLIPSVIKLNNSTYSGMESVFWKFMPIFLNCIFIIFIFFLIKFFKNGKIASLITGIIVVTMALFSAFTIPEIATKDILETIDALADAKSEIIISESELFQKFKPYDSPKHPILPEKNSESKTFWTIKSTQSESSDNPTEKNPDFQITREIATDKYIALEFSKTQEM